MRTYIDIINEAQEQLNELFGLSSKEKAAKSLAATGDEIKAAMQIRHTIESAKAVDALAVKALGQGADAAFFQKLGFESRINPQEAQGTFYVPDVWTDMKSVHEFQTVYGVERLAGPVSQQNKIDEFSIERRYPDRTNKWVPRRAFQAWISRADGNHEKLIFRLK
jgi:hypothetical protein